MNSNNIMNKAKTSFLWSFCEKVSVQGLGFIVSLVLARLLSPEDYGTIAIITVFCTIANVFIDCGILKSLIQNQNCKEIDYSTAFLMNVMLGVFCYILLYISSPFIAIFFKMPTLCNITRVYAIVLIVTSLNVVQRARYQKVYNFRTITVISLVALLVGGFCGLYLAFAGYGVWALVFYYLVMETVRTILYWVLGGWCPAFVFSKHSFKRIYSFSSKLLAANMFHIIVYNLYTFVVGKIYNATVLGVFSRGQSIANLFPANMSYVMEQASYPVLCNVQNDKSLLKYYFDRYVQLSFALTVPVCSLLIILAKPLVLVILTDKWIEVVYFVQVLAIAYAFDPIMRLNAVVVNTTGKSEYSLYSEILKKTFLIIILIVTCFWGIKAMAWGMVLNSIADIFVVMFFVKKVTGYSFMDEVKNLSSYLFSSLILMLFVFICTYYIYNEYLKIVCGCIVGFIAYSCSLRLLAKKQFHQIINLVRSIIKSNNAKS